MPALSRRQSPATSPQAADVQDGLSPSNGPGPRIGQGGPAQEQGGGVGEVDAGGLEGGGGLPAEHWARMPANARGRFTFDVIRAAGAALQVEDVLGGGRFEAPITRAEAATVLSRVLGLGTALEGNPGLFSDVGTEHWAAASIYRAREEGLISGQGQGRFAPNAALEPAHAAALVARVSQPGAFDRAAAVQESDRARPVAGGDDEVLSEVARGLAAYEGTAPDQVHYDSGVVNWGVGSNTGAHIARLLDQYEQLATAQQQLERLYAHFGGRSNFDALRDRFRRQGQGARLSAAETGWLRSLGRDTALVQAQYDKAGEDAAAYVDQIGRFSPPYPFRGEDGSVSELACHVFAAAAHQSGGAAEPYRSALARAGGVSGARAMGETRFLKLVRDVIVSWVEGRYRVGVTNRYDSLVNTYGGSSRRYSFGRGGQGAALEGQVVADGAGVAGVQVTITDGRGQPHTVTTNASGFFTLAGPLEPGRVVVEAEGKRQELQVVEGRHAWARVDASAAHRGPDAPGDEQTEEDVLVEDIDRLLEGDDRAGFDGVRQAFGFIVGGQLDQARSEAAARAAAFRQERGLRPGDPHPVTDALGLVWQVGRALADAQQALAGQDFARAKQRAHDAAERTRGLISGRLVEAEVGERVVRAAQGWWTQANEAAKGGGGNTGKADRGRYAAWTTGRAGGGITSRELASDGSWDFGDVLAHHSDRSRSWAADNIRNDKNQDLNAYDFTFERTDAQGRAVAGSAQGLPLIAPWDARVIDLQDRYQGSGGLGCFVALEDVETGLRFEVHHLDAVAPLRKGQVIRGGTVIGNQGAAGNGRHDYATHVDIVGTKAAVEQFVRANQSGEFRTRIEQDPGR